MLRGASILCLTIFCACIGAVDGSALAAEKRYVCGLSVFARFLVQCREQFFTFQPLCGDQAVFTKNP